ncbi:MAG: thiamine pyrophosphate-dependent dehydrogenase E1 component subunit alpha [Deltaproteobacteria bacterium]|nr:thiamine pyrophosphate-dependent dehydrogenase E1 component subunit alpha [Deltaproteobacteria bacterium]
MDGTTAQSTRAPGERTPGEVLRVLRDDGKPEPALDPRIPDAESRELYRHMLETRLLDERLTALQRQGRIGFHVGSLGEEGAILGAAFALRPNDFIFPCYREFGAALLRGLDFQRFIDNMFGNANDTVKGRQMPDHYTSRATRWVSISSPVGTQITQAVGFAWAAKLRREDLASLVFFGDGATSSSDFHSGMNFAGVFKVPVVFLCRNNGWAISVPAERQTASESFAVKGRAYGVPSVRVDGNDVFAVVRAVREALARGSRGEGPTLIEAITYRMGGHSTSDDPNAYRGSDAVTAWAPRDPLARLRRYLELRGAWSEADERAALADVDRRLREAVEIAERTPKPPLESLFDDVYAKRPWHLEEQRAALLAGPRAPEHG